MLESWSMALKTRIIAMNPMKFWATKSAQNGSTDDVIQKNAKPTPIMMSSTKIPKPKTKKNFFSSKLQDF